MENRSLLRFVCRTSTVLFAVAVLVGLVHAEPPSWPQFRGSGGLASAPDQRIPDEFGPDRNVRWQREVPAGHSSPVIWGDRLFITGYHDSALQVLCYRRSDGELMWKKEFGMTGREKLLHRDATPAAPTPATDGKRVHAYFGAYGLVTLDIQGNLVWEHEFQVEPGPFGTGSSPILHGDTLFLVRDVAGLSMVHAFDAATGEQRWARPRPEASDNYSTPFIWKHGDREELIVAGSAALKAYDLKDGKPLWWVNNVTEIVCPSPTGGPG
jgi:outer membrane protein assembly factor BamB